MAANPPMIDGPFPANMPESERFRRPKPDHHDVERRQSGNLPDQPAGNPVVNPSPVRWTTPKR